MQEILEPGDAAGFRQQIGGLLAKGASLEEALCSTRLGKIDLLPFAIEIPGSSRTPSIHYQEQGLLHTLDENDWSRIVAAYENGFLDSPMVQFGEGISLGDLSFSWGQEISPLDGMPGTVLEIGWGDGQGIRLLMPRGDDMFGDTVYRFYFAEEESWHSLSDLLALAPPADFPQSGEKVFTWDPATGSRIVDTLDYAALRLLDDEARDWRFSQEDNDLLITDAHAGTTLRVQNWRAFGWFGKTPVEFSDGSKHWGGGLIQHWTTEAGESYVSDMVSGDGQTHVSDGSVSWMSGSNGNDALLGGDGDDGLNGYGGDDLLHGGRGNDRLDGGAGDDVLNGGSGDDRLVGGKGDDILRGGEGFDILYGDSGNDTLHAGAGGGKLYGEEGHDTYLFHRGDGEVTVFLDAGANTVRFGTGILPDDVDVSYDRYRSELTLSIQGTSDVLRFDYYWYDYANNQFASDFSFVFEDGTVWRNSTLPVPQKGSDAADQLIGTSFRDVLWGGGGDDLLQGGSGDDYLDGGPGADTLWGGPGDDTFVVDDVGDHVGELPNEGTDTVLSSVSYTLLNREEIENLTLTGSADIDATGNDLDNVLQGNSGNNILDGGSGNDIYLFGRGGGQDTIIKSDFIRYQQGTLRFGEGIGPQDIRLSYSGPDLIVEIIGSDDRITIRSFDPPIFSQNPIQRMEFADGTVWMADALPQTLRGGDGDDALFGGPGDDLLDGGAGDDWLRGAEGDDTLIGGEGSDFLAGNWGDDTYVIDDDFDQIWEAPDEGVDTVLSSISYVLPENVENLTLTGSADIDATGNELANVLQGNSGNNLLNGGAGNDTYRFGRGDGRDMIIDGFGDFDGKLNTLRFADDLGPEDIVLTRSESDLIVGIAGGDDQIVISAFYHDDSPYNPFNSIQQMVFGDGTVWNIEAIEAVVAGLPPPVDPDDNHPPAGMVTISGQTLQNQTLTVSHDLADADGLGTVAYQWQSSEDGTQWTDVAGGNDSQLALTEALVGQRLRVVASYTDGHGTAESVTSAPTGAVADVNDAPVFNGPALAGQTVRSGQFLSFSVPGGWFSDPDAGDVLSYSATRADGSALPGWLVFDPATLSFSGTPAAGDVGSLALRIVATDAGGLSAGSEAFPLTVEAASRPPQTGTNSADTLTGDAEDDVLLGLAGNDTLNGHGGDDLLDGGAGSDRMAGGPGGDTYVVDASGDVVTEKSGEGVDRVHSSVTYTLPAHVENLLLLGTAAINGTGNTLDNHLTGNAGNNTLSGHDGSDVLQGGPGNDTLNGNAGDDTYVFSAGDGQDTLNESSGVDTLRFAEANLADLTFLRSGNHLVVAYGENDRVSLQNHFSSNANYRVEWIETADSGRHSLAELLKQTPVHLSESKDSVSFGDTNDLVHAGAGNDTVSGGAGQDTLLGEAGNDTLNGNDGDDTLAGGPGNDTLNGNAGDDTYVFSTGDGQDTLNESSGVDTLRFAEANLADLTFTRSGNHLVVAYGENDRVSLQNHFSSSANYRVEWIETADGDRYALAELLKQTPVHLSEDKDSVSFGDTDDLVHAGAGNDTVSGGAGQDTLLGEAGNDTLNGNDGSDVLQGGPGNDTLNGNAGDDTYVFSAGDGQDTLSESGGVDTLRFTEARLADLSFLRSGNHLIVAYGDTDRVSLQSHFSSNANYRVEWIETADGDRYALAELLKQTPVHLSEGKDSVSFGDTDDVVRAGAGNDTVSGGAGQDTLLGEAGNDTLNGNDGDDTLAGGPGNDTLNGNAGDDTYVFSTGDGQDTLSESSGVDTLRFAEANLADLTFLRSGNHLVVAYGGDDRVSLQNHFSSNANYRVEWIETADGGRHSLAGLLEQTPVHLSEDKDSVSFGDTDDLVHAGAGNDTVSGGAGQDVLLGEAGNDTLNGNDGSDLLLGGVGNDTLNGNDGSDLLVGGAGDDTLNGQAGDDLILFNAGDGRDSLSASGGHDTLSLGGGIGYDDLTFGKSGNHLVLGLGAQDQITFTSWYSSASYRSVVTLQMIAEAMDDFAAGGGDPLRDQKIETFDFAGLVTAFDTARAATPALSNWALSNALLDHHLSGSDTAALGGDLAYQYGKTGSLAGIGVAAAQEILGEAGFATQAQALKPLAELSAGTKLG
jgi:Ca2+-binding RTX toxin-like protein